MDKYVIKGGTPLHGEIVVSGAKNAAVALVAATILCDEPCVLENVPEISDISICIKILKEMGADVKIIGKNTVEFDTTRMTSPVVPYQLARSIERLAIFSEHYLADFTKHMCRFPADVI